MTSMELFYSYTTDIMKTIESSKMVNINESICLCGFLYSNDDVKNNNG